MSYSQTFDALRNAPILTKTQSYVLAQIATFTNAAGKCFPSVETLAAACKMTARSLQRHMAALVNMGFLERIYRRGRSAFTRIRLDVLGAGRPTPDTTVYKPPTVLSPTPDSSVTHNLSLESEYQITAQPAAPVVAESPASAAIVVFESVDTEVMDTAPVVDLVAVDLVADPLPVVDLVAVDLVADPLPVVDLVQAVDAPAMPNAPIDPLAAVPASLMKDFGDTRRFKGKAPKVTLLERQVLAREAAKARLTVEDVVKLCILRGWSHFEAVFATPVVMASFYAQMGMDQAPAMAPQSLYVHEVVPPASPSVISAAKAAMAAALARMKAAPPVDPLAGQKAILAKHARGEHVSPYALDAARLALRV
jgi:DNA-binding transcriptional ArsR family regulator